MSATFMSDTQETDWQREMEQRGKQIAYAMGRYRGMEPLVDAVARLASDYHEAKVGQLSAPARLSADVLNEVGIELAKARQTHAPMNGHHEGYAVILEELDELWEECKRNTHKQSIVNIAQARADKRAAMRKEAIQVAAMAIRFIEDVCDK